MVIAPDQVYLGEKLASCQKMHAILKERDWVFVRCGNCVQPPKIVARP